MFCTSCGSNVSDENKYCPECGASTSNDANPNNNVHTIPLNMPFQTTPAYYKKSGNGWISGMKIFSWILFGAIILVGLIAGGSLMLDSPAGILVILASIVIAFLSVAGTMIFLNMAHDISAIRNYLERK